MPSIDKKDLREKAVTALFFAGVFLPVRLLFYTYVSQWWLGSFGMMTIILVSLFYLAKRGKLGRLGFVVMGQLDRMAKGKLGAGGLVAALFIIYFYSNMIYGIETAPDQTKMLISSELEREGVRTIQDVGQKLPEARLEWTDIILGVILLVAPHEGAHSVYSVINDMSDGWALHFATVLLVQELEIAGLIIYFRYFRKNLSASTTTIH